MKMDQEPDIGDPPLDPPTPEEEEAEAWEYWHQRAISLESATVDALSDAAQFIDTIRQDALREGWWTDWDQQMREKITKALALAHRRRSQTSTLGTEK